jgi:predicted  nucleic acid-binding Zn-ribbon protein
MAEKKPPEFRFNVDDQEEPDEFYHEEMRDLRVEKLSQRITVISILLPCLIAVAIYFGYRDLTDRVHKGRDNRDFEVKQLSKQMEVLSEKFNEKLDTFSTAISSQDQKFSDSISGQLNAINNNIDVLNKNMTSLNENMEQAQNSIKKLDKAKVDKKSQAVAIANLKADLDPLKNAIQSLTDLRADMKSISAEINDLESQITAEMTRVAGNTAKFQKEYDLLQASIAEQLSEKIDKAALGVELLIFKKNQSNHSQEITRLTQRLDSIQKKIEGTPIDSKLNRQPEELIPDELPSPQSAVNEKSDSFESNEDIKMQEQDLPPE